MKSNFNTIVKTHHIYEFEQFFNYFNEINYGNLNYDALWKWSGILHSFSQIQDKPMLIGRFVFKK